MEYKYKLLFLAIVLVNSIIADEVHDEALKMIPLINYKLDKEGVHHYNIPIVYRDANENDLKFFDSYKNVLNVDYLSKKKGFSFSSIKILSTNELMEIYMNRSHGMGDIPNWVELILLSKKKAENFPSKKFELQVINDKLIDQKLHDLGIKLGQFTRIQRNCFDLRFPISENSQDSLVINTRAALCIGHDAYSWRVVNSKDQIEWQKLQSLGGDISYLRVNIDADDSLEIIFHEDNHGEKSMMVFDPR